MARPSDTAKRLILDIIKAAGGMFPGRIRLNFAFYLAHLNHWQARKGVLSDYPIVRHAYGPGALNLDDLLLELWTAGKIEVISDGQGLLRDSVFRLTGPLRRDAAAKGGPVDEAVRTVLYMPLRELIERVCEFSRSWQSTPENEHLDIYSDLLSEEQYLRVRSKDERIGALVDDITQTFR